jgi:hypothetical protein
MTRRVGDLELEQDLEFQRREWSVQRVGWWALSLFVLAAALGLFGSGPLSHARVGEPGAPLWIEYERFVRVGAADRLRVHLGPLPAGADTRDVRFNREYFESLHVERITPEPERTLVASEQVTLIFDPNDMRDEGTLIIDARPGAVGRQVAHVSSGELPRVSFSQFAYF